VSHFAANDSRLVDLQWRFRPPRCIGARLVIKRCSLRLRVIAFRGSLTTSFPPPREPWLLLSKIITLDGRPALP